MNKKVPDFIEIEEGALKIAPMNKHIGKHSITIELIDEFDA
jgi:hypothetical protein